MKKIIFAGITAVLFSCGMGVASAYSYNNEQAAKKALQVKESSCASCSCDDCACTDCTHGNCSAACCVHGTPCSSACATK